MSRFKHRTAKIDDDQGNSVVVRALTPGEREKVAEIAKEEGGRSRLPYFIFSTCCTEPRMSENEVREEVPTQLLDLACTQIMDWSMPPPQKKA